MLIIVREAEGWRFAVDVTVFHRGFHGDLNETFLVGDKVDEQSRKLVAVTYECLQEAISIGEHFFSISFVFFD